MHRRKFIGLAALSTPAALAAEAESDVPYEAWWDAIDNPTEYTAATDGILELKVTLFTPPEGSVKEVENGDGSVHYQLEGKRLPDNFSPGHALLTKFEFSWDGKTISVDKRFWNDLCGLQVQSSKLKLEDIKPQHLKPFLEFLQSLQQPRVILSHDKGTALIEWERNEECDSRSMIRWMISRTGTVLRHRHGHDGC